MKRQASKYAIHCSSNNGPCFFDGAGRGWDIGISHNCNVYDSYINNDGTRGYKCHPVHKMSLFVGTNGKHDRNIFIVSDYEVFAQQ